MLQTLDLNTLVRILMEMYGRELRLRFRKMNQEERDAAEEPMEIVTAVRTRFLLIELWSDGSEVRREDLEERIIHEGQK